MKIPEKGNVVLKFGSSWCGPCRLLKPIIEELKEENKSIEFLDIDVDEHPEFTKKYIIKGIPKLVFLRDGEIQSDLVGLKSKAEIQESINLLLE